jgi:hypothetical protein
MKQQFSIFLKQSNNNLSRNVAKQNKIKFWNLVILPVKKVRNMLPNIPFSCLFLAFVQSLARNNMAVSIFCFFQTDLVLM